MLDDLALLICEEELWRARTRWNGHDGCKDSPKDYKRPAISLTLILGSSRHSNCLLKYRFRGLRAFEGFRQLFLRRVVR